MNLFIGGGSGFQLHPRPFEIILNAHGLKAQLFLKWVSLPPTGVSSLLLLVVRRWGSVGAAGTAPS